MSIYQKIIHLRAQSKKGLAILLDPDEVPSDDSFDDLISTISKVADFIMVGGSILLGDGLHALIEQIKQKTSLPVILFPGSGNQISAEADAILLLSLISGRNPDLLIGQHVQSALNLKRSGLEIIPTAYLLIDGGKPTSASYISNTLPIPNDKSDIAAATALAGEQLGLKCIYLDGGSGAEQAVRPKMIQAVREITSLPLFVGGGIRSELQMKAAFDAGADIVVVGTAFEQNPELIASFSKMSS
ncbi:MAG: geranylgeranylglyceryl/heptaprenylglyceryl phosphate synthase [Flavobacteriales bacterium]|nr:geranylgeranylglyceryl/heptaprenylglyceryl phosphate synthase [Flavobacteriales bacterium]MDG1767458.1 geranylgeranylglyceryl/heptaprenylglyceryl phosphate synthase [Flavobacteriales bacterium]